MAAARKLNPQEIFLLVEKSEGDSGVKPRRLNRSEKMRFDMTVEA